MIISPGGPDIPESLLRSQRAGDVMFIVGAGVSKAAGLPLFGELVEMVYGRLGQPFPGRPGSLATSAEFDAYQAGQFDRLIGLLEQRVVYRGVEWRQPSNRVRDAVGELVKPKPRAPFSAHLDLLDLSRGSDGYPRIVTTNFDTIFEKAWFRSVKKKLASFAGPGMPMVGSGEFAGVMHIHGRIGDPRLGLAPTDLVLSAPNFGEAYMRSGWASRTVYDLLRRYTVVLVGYAADDPPMRYMLEATEEGRLSFPDLKPAYALVADETGDVGSLREAWRGKGLQPLIFSVRDGSYAPLYETLSAWANLIRDPLQWSESRLSQIAAVPYSTASEMAHQEFAFLANEISSTTVASSHAADPQWLDALLGQGKTLDDWSYQAWFRERLSSATAARYAVEAADSAKQQIARVVDLLLRLRDAPIAEPYALFWQLYVQAFGRSKPSVFGRIRATGKPGAGHIRDYVSHVEPRLTIEKRLSYFDGEEVAEPRNIHDLARFSFKAENGDWQRRLEKWPADAKLEERLIAALDRALGDALDMAAEAGLIGTDGDLMSFDVGLVHAPDKDDGLVDPNDRHGANWRLNSPDAHNDRFAPIIRTITGLWLRLSGREPRAAERLAANWAQRDQIIYKRIAAWAAIASPAGPARELDEYLRGTTRKRFWMSDNSPEIARFYCKRWNMLDARTRTRIEAAILAGLDAATIRRIARPAHRDYVKALYKTRELARIVTAGGRLSRATATKLRGFYKLYPDLPRDMPVYAHLYSPSWSGSGYSADTSVLANVADDQLLESVEHFEQSERWEQADLWRAFAQSEAGRAFNVLLNAQRIGQFSAERWQPLLSLYTRGFPTGEDVQLPALADILAAVLAASDESLAPLKYVIGSIISQRAEKTSEPIFPLVLVLWDRMVPIAAAPDDDNDHDKPLFSIVHSHPVAELTASLMTMQSNVARKRGGGFAAQFASRFDALVELDGRPRQVAIAALVRQLPFLDWLNPKWVKRHLSPELDAQTDMGRDLMSVIATSNAMHVPRVFNMLKQPLFRALEHGDFDQGAREQLSGALVGAAFALIGGSKGFKLSKFEVRHALTRIPNKTLASMAWELSSLLRHQPEAKREAYWMTSIEPFLHDFWPNDVAARSPEVSSNLGRLPALAGAAFPRAVDVVLGLVRPIGLREIQYGLGLDEESDNIKRFPRSALMLIAAMTARGETPPGDLAETIRALLDADESIAAEPSFWRLRQMLRPN